MDNLEKFINENRADLDRYEAPEGSWDRIRNKTGRKKTGMLYRIAAAVIIILVTGITIIYVTSVRPARQAQAVSSPVQELRETEMYYNALYKSMYNEAKPKLTGQPDIEKELKEGAAQIDSICSDLKKDLKDNVANREVIEALVRNYRIKIKLLEDMLGVIDQNEKNENKSKSHEL